MKTFITGDVQVTTLRLPATPAEFIAGALDPALRLLPTNMDTPEARGLIVAIVLQESGLKHRYQVVAGNSKAKGPARGLPQFERGGGCYGVLNHDASRFWMRTLCEARNVKPTVAALWKAMETDDILGCCAARLLLFTDRRRLPKLGDEIGAWLYYLHNWRPGKRHRDRWSANYSLALKSMMPDGGVPRQ